jgi:hypothetical protein
MFLQTRSVLSLSPLQTVIRDDPTLRRTLSEEFARCHALAFSAALDMGFVEILRQVRMRATYVTQTLPGIGNRDIEGPPHTAGRTICAALEHPELTGWLGAVTGLAPLTHMIGKVAEFVPRSEAALDWHTDAAAEGWRRKLAITINLSDQPFDGGLFELRERATGKIVVSHSHRGLGSMLVFRISERLDHRVQPITSGGPRRMFSGWFYGPPPDEAGHENS